MPDLRVGRYTSEHHSNYLGAITLPPPPRSKRFGSSTPFRVAFQRPVFCRIIRSSNFSKATTLLP
jgi:hypothetical protein